jgi:hypothetical protein
MSVLRIALAASFAACIFSVAAAQTATGQSAAPSAVPPASLDQAPPAPAATPQAPSAAVAGANASVTVSDSGVRNTTVASPPVPDTPANRSKFGAPMSHAGRVTSPTGD